MAASVTALLTWPRTDGEEGAVADQLIEGIMGEPLDEPIDWSRVDPSDVEDAPPEGPIDWSFEDPADTHPNQGPTPLPTDLDPGESACGLPAGDQAVPTTAPVATWEVFNEVAIPVAADLGPGLTGNTMHTCYAHSPTGALYAAAGMVADQRAFDTRVMLKGRTVWAPEVDAAVDRTTRAAEYPITDGPVRQVAGYRFATVGPDLVVLDMALRTTGKSSAVGALTSTTVTLRWEGNDWLAVMLPTERIWTEPVVLADLTGYVPWSAG